MKFLSQHGDEIASVSSPLKIMVSAAQVIHSRTALKRANLLN